MDATSDAGEKRWLSVREAAARLGVAAGTVYEMVDKDRLTHYRVGAGRGKIVFRPSDLDAYLESRRSGPRPKPLPQTKPRMAIPRPKKDHCRR